MVKEIELINQNIVLWFLCVKEDKSFNTNNVAWKSFQNVLHTTLNEIKLQKVIFSKDMIEKYKEEITFYTRNTTYQKTHGSLH